MRKAHEVKWRKDVEPFRIFGKREWGTTGGFQFGSVRVICSDGDGWDHVSVSRVDRIPSYEEMCMVKALFFGDEETVMQLPVRSDEHINHHPNCLHLRRPQTCEIPQPPKWMV